MAELLSQAARERRMTAEFRTVKDAKALFEHVQGPGWHMVDVKRQGRTVTWFPSEQATTYHFSNMLETVGSFGSSQRFKAKLNGVPAPIEY